MARMIFAVLLSLAVYGAVAQSGYNLPVPAPNGFSYGAPGLRSDASTFNGQGDPLEALAINIPGGGVPGESYPILSSVPDTGLSCDNQEYPGYYADDADDARCQVFHICQFDGRQDSFLCPNGTIFNQQYFVCDWWFNVDCSATGQYTRLNADIGIIPTVGGDASSRSDILAPRQGYSAPGFREAPRNGLSAPSSSYSAPNRF